MDNFSVIFMGTPEFAVEILQNINENNVEIKAVVTAPDKPSGRGRKLNQSAVKKYAVENNLNVLQPTNLKDPEFIEQLEGLNASLFVVVAFRMLPEVVWSMPELGTINLHASLLPNYRGAAPINWAIINGEKETGVTTFFIEKEIDTGKIIDRSAVEIGNNETVGELYNRLMKLGASVMLNTVKKIKEGNVESIDQQELILDSHKPAPKIFKNDCEINFNQPVQSVHNFCRGLTPYPAAWCTLYNNDNDESKTFKIHRTEITSLKVKDANQVISNSDGIFIPTSDFYMRILEIQPEGKRKMTFKEFLAGNSVENLVTKGVS